MKRLLFALALLLSWSFALAAVNINTATKEELDALPGIGPVKAQAIIDYRNANGPFKSPEDVMKVKGIKEGEFSKLKGTISTSGATTAPPAPAKAEPMKAAAPAAPAPAKAEPMKAAAPAAPAPAPATPPMKSEPMKAAAPAPAAAPAKAEAPKAAAKDDGKANMSKADEEKAAKAKAKEDKAKAAAAAKEAKAKAKADKAAQKKM